MTGTSGEMLLQNNVIDYFYEGKNSAAQPRRVAVYCRVSTFSDQQDGSFETQRDYYIRLIESRSDMILAGVYGDQGKSGRSIEGRPQFQRMLRDCQAGKIDLILTKSVSRFARNLSECITTIRQLQEWGVAIIFEKEGLDTGDKGNELLLGILATIAQEESNSISQNMRWSKKRQNEMGRPSDRVSYGYYRKKPGYEWEINEAEARRVRAAFQMACCGCNYNQILNTLQEMERSEGTKKVWKHNPMIYMLTNICYIGDYLTNKKCWIETEKGRAYVWNKGQVDQYYIEGHHEPIVSRAVFDMVRELISRRLLYSKRSRFTREEVRLLAESCQLAVVEWGEEVVYRCQNLQGE